MFIYRRCVCLQGVTIPSQRRYVEYFHRLRQSRAAYRPTDLYLQAVTLEPERALENIGSSELWAAGDRETAGLVVGVLCESCEARCLLQKSTPGI